MGNDAKKEETKLKVVEEATDSESGMGEKVAGETGEPGKVLAKETDPVVLNKLLGEQKTRAQDYYDRLLRLQAEYENFRRRTRQEKEEIYKYASEELVCAILPVLDNFERALAAEGESVESFKRGVELIFRQLMDVLESQGVVQIPAAGEQFDPEKHEAVFREESEHHPDNTIIEEFRRGYILKDKVIRPSMVKVSKSS